MATAPLPPSFPAAGGRTTPAPAPVQEDCWLFGRYRLEPARKRLQQADGPALTLDPRACAVLACLLRHAGSVVPRATLIAEAWPGVDTVFDSAVSKVMRRLRTALGDHSGHVLQTVYGEGYRLALPAVLLPRPPAPLEPGSGPRAAPAPAPVHRPPPRGWLAWLPWAIATLATLAAMGLAWLLLRPGVAA